MVAVKIGNTLRITVDLPEKTGAANGEKKNLLGKGQRMEKLHFHK